jgi:NAD-dependent SIR2 family protein deacetylase
MKAVDLEKKLGKKKHKTTSELKHIISTRADQNPNFCLFLGSGASRSSGIRTAGEMVQEWRRKVYKDLSGTTDDCPVEQMQKWLSQHASDWYDENREYASLIERFHPLPTNRRKFIETEVADKIPSIGYAYLVRIAEAGLLRTIFTTNFDDLLNEAFYQFSSERALVCAHDSSVHSISITSRRTKIIKLHGDYLFDDLKNTTTETKNLAENMREKLGEFVKEYGLIFAGYSGSDRSITRTLLDMCGKDVYLRNGLYWCFRDEDEITAEALEILQCPNCFYVLTSGFDELMADIYTTLPTDATPFNSKLASDRASHIIDTYLQSSHLKSTSSQVIRKHLEALEADKNASVLSDLMKDLNAESIASAGLTDKNLLVYLEIERALKDRNPELALVKLGEELAKNADRRFKEILLRRRVLCSTRLNKFAEAREAVKQMLDLEPENFYMSLNECSLIENRVDRLEYLERLKTQHPYSAPVLNAYAEELSEALERRDKIRSGLRPDDVVATLKRSLDVDPSLENGAWSQLFDFYSKQGAATRIRDSLGEIVDKHLAQDAFDSRTSRMLFRYCRKFKASDYKGKPLFEYLQHAYAHHFPRQYSAHLDILVDACIEFEGNHLLRPILEEARENEFLKDDPQFAITMMDVYYDVFRDLPGAISHGREFLKANKKSPVEMKLVDLYLENGDPQKAREIHLKLKGAIAIGIWLREEAKILEYERRYQDAIDTIESIPDRRDFKEKYTQELSFLELKMDAPTKAHKRCREFLEERSFSVHFEAEIINYEYSKKLDGKNIAKDRVAGVAEATQSEAVKAVCKSLLGLDADALEIFRQEAHKRFSRIHDFLRWPAISRHENELRAIRDDLLKAKRSLTDFPKS